MKPELRALVVGASTSPVCGVRDYATLLTPAFRGAGLAAESVWWERDEGAGVRSTLRACRIWTDEVAGRAAAGGDVVLWNYSPFTYAFRGVPLLAPLVALRLRRAGLPVVAVFHELGRPWTGRGWRGAVQAAAQRVSLAAILPLLSGAVVTTDQRARWLRTRGWRGRRPLAVAPVFSNLPAPKPRGPARNGNLRAAVFGFRRDTVDPEPVVSAIGLARRRGLDARLVLLGAPGADGPEAGAWRRAAARAGCADALSFTGVLPAGELAAELHAADLIVFPHRSGPAPRKGTLAAALAAGKAIVAFDGPETWPALARSDAVSLVPPEPQPLAEALERLASDEAGRRALGRRAARFYGERMAPEVVAAQLAGFLARVAANGSADHRPRVALVAHDVHDGGGMERAFAELIRNGRRDCRFVVVSSTLAPDLRPLVDWRRVPVPRRPFPLKFVSFFLAAGLRLLTVRADLVHTLGAIVPRRADVATIQFCHAGFLEATGRLAPSDAPVLRRLNTAAARRLALAAERWSYRPQRLRLLAAVSHGVAGEVERHYPGIPVAVTPNGVDVGRARPDEDERRELRLAEGVGDGETVALFLGGDWDRKGLAVAIGGLALARATGGPARLWVVGRGPEERFAALARRHGVADRVRFFGHRRDPERFCRAADLLVLPSLYETFCIAAYEAAAAGLPVVATPVSGVAELVGADEAGVLVERDEASVGAAISRLVRDPELRARLGAEGRRRAGSFGWEASAAAVVSSYAALLHPTPRTEPAC